MGVGDNLRKNTYVYFMLVQVLRTQQQYKVVFAQVLSSFS